jgi:hypothetical protein
MVIVKLNISLKIHLLMMKRIVSLPMNAQNKELIEFFSNDDRKFKLSESFINQYKNIEPNFGFNGLGEIVYLRSYSRIKTNGEKEKWFETITRVVEGAYNIQKAHATIKGINWSDEKAQMSARRMYKYMFEMKFLPPGRGLTTHSPR